MKLDLVVKLGWALRRPLTGGRGLKPALAESFQTPAQVAPSRGGAD